MTADASQLQARVESGLKTLRTLIMTRPKHRLRFLDVLLEFTSSDQNEVRSSAMFVLRHIVPLYF